MADPVLRARGIVKAFAQGGRPVPVLSGADLDVGAGEMVALVGASGAGKSTLLHILGLLERADAGRLTIAGRAAGALADRAATALRREAVGFVYQAHCLLPDFSALDNIALPQMIAGAPVAQARARARALLAGFDLAERAAHRPAELSGGQAQRVAIARALANGPAVLLADEPTGNLDAASAAQVMDVLCAAVRGRGLAAVVATHNAEIAGRADRVVRLTAGRLEPVG
jgi:lipoprotein-releasing system ATP-binding protein